MTKQSSSSRPPPSLTGDHACSITKQSTSKSNHPCWQAFGQAAWRVVYNCRLTAAIQTTMALLVASDVLFVQGGSLPEHGFAFNCNLLGSPGGTLLQASPIQRQLCPPGWHQQQPSRSYSVAISASQLDRSSSITSPGFLEDSLSYNGTCLPIGLPVS
ncbi:unnamed protein product [Linum tenue]|uniref:Uncharacterized protein n=1 Tax=Linum tenue TaxID=586396 RepID=A0AAV0RWH7_9ROSI|nr:unnamed protein product [Linum tenue]